MSYAMIIWSWTLLLFLLYPGSGEMEIKRRGRLCGHYSRSSKEGIVGSCGSEKVEMMAMR